MNQNTLNDELVRKNIEMIRLYSNEEQGALKSIFSELFGALRYYSGPNNSALCNKINFLKSNKITMYYNRIEYTRILNQAIKIYDRTSEEFLRSAKIFENSINVSKGKSIRR